MNWEEQIHRRSPGTMPPISFEIGKVSSQEWSLRGSVLEEGRVVLMGTVRFCREAVAPNRKHCFCLPGFLACTELRRALEKRWLEGRPT